MYNQPFSQPPGMFGAQSAMAQMQSAPSLPAGNPGAREYFNYSMETLSNAAMPQAMMPQGIGSLVPQYQFGGGVSLADAISMASNAPDIESVEAAFDAAGIDVPDFNAPSGPGFDPGTSYETSNPSTSGRSGSGSAPFSPDAAMADEAIRSQQAAEFNTLREAEGGMLYTKPVFDGPVLSLVGPRTIKNAIGKTMPVQTVLANLPYVGGLISRAMTSGYADNEFGDFPGDVVSTPSQSEIDDIIARMTPPDTGDDGEPDLGDPQQAAAAVAPAYVPPVYQTYAGLGLPSVSPIPPLRRVTVPISNFVV